MADNGKMFQNGNVFKAFVLSVLRQKAADIGVPILFNEPLYKKKDSDYADAAGCIL